MRKILFIVIISMSCFGVVCLAAEQTAEDYEEAGLAHFKNAYHKAMPDKNRSKANAEFDLAEKAFQKAIEKNPNRFESYLYLGRTYFVQKKYLQAAEQYRKVLVIAPEKREIFLQLASALEMAGDYKGAIRALEEMRSQETDPRAIQVLDDFIGKMKIKAKERN
jgi:tetratricopeptide (TPR) repeat protein